MERSPRAGDGPGRRLLLEWLRLSQPFAGRQGDHRHELERTPLLRAEGGQERRAEQSPAARPSRPGAPAVKRGERKIVLRCAVYTRVSTQSGLEQDFNSLDNQREASDAYIK